MFWLFFWAAAVVATVVGVERIFFWLSVHDGIFPSTHI